MKSNSFFGAMAGVFMVGSNAVRLARTLANDIDARDRKQSFSYCPIRAKRENFQDERYRGSYIVSRRGYGKTFKKYPSAPQFFVWILFALPALSGSDTYIGGWWSDDGLFYVDVSIPVEGKQAALLFGFINEQQEIYHPATGKCINIREALGLIPTQPALA